MSAEIASTTRGLPQLRANVLGVGASSASALPTRTIPTSNVEPPLAATTPSWRQARGSSGDDFVGGMIADSLGDVIVAGCFSAPIDLGCGAMTPTGTTDTFVVKYASDGTCLWSKHFGGTADQWSTSIASDASGNLYVSGDFRGSATFGATTITSAGGYDGWIAALTADGAPKWAASLGGAQDDDAFGAAVVGSNVVTVGDFAGSMTAAGTTLTSQAGWNGYAVSFAASNGAAGWARAFRGDADVVAYDIAPLGAGFVIGGSFTGAADLGGGAIAAAGSSDGFVAAYDASGALAWSSTFGGPGVDFVRAVSIAPDGGVLATGYFTSSAGFAGSTVPTITGVGSGSGFVAKVDTSGAPTWARAIDATGLATATSVAADANGSVLVTGWFEGTATLPGRSVAARGADDTFVARYDAGGNGVGSVTYGGSGSAGGCAVVAPSAGAMAVAGFFGASIDLGGGAVSGAGGTDVYVVSSAAP